MSDNLQAYPEYKDSGVDWLGDVPLHWEVDRIKHFINEINERSKNGDEELLSVSQYTGVTPRKSRVKDGKQLTNAESLKEYKIVSTGDLVINIMLAWNGSLGRSEYDGIVSPSYAVFRFLDSYNSRFYHYLFRTPLFKGIFKTVSTGVVESRLRLYPDVFGRLPSVVPPPDEQDAIVRFLDVAEAHIKRYIRAKQKLIKLLTEQKQAIIQQAVTRGLNPDVPMKDSGVEWLGEIPAHWKQSRLKFTASHIVDCLHATPTYITSGEFPAVRTADVQRGNVNVDGARKLDYEQYKLWTVRLIPREGDILYTREGERYGLAALVPPNVELCISQRMMVFRIKSGFHSGYLMWQLNAPHVYEQASQDIGGATSPHINISTIKNYWLVIPPINEQISIDQHIVQKHKILNEIIERARHEIALIREYRTRLIADVVTGKVDVRGRVFEMPEAFAEDDLLEVDEDELFDDEEIEVDG